MYLKQYLKTKRVLTDGAMGTYYERKYDREPGVAIAEEANLLYPQRIREIHLEYLRAGADLLRTNTFAVNSFFFPDTASVKAHIRAGWRLASEAVEAYQKEEMERGNKRRPVFIAADLGPVSQPLGEDRFLALEEAEAICDVFLEEGADNFIFETQADFQILPQLAAYIKEKKPDSFLLAQFSFDKSGFTKGGISIRRMLELAGECRELDAYGFNCGVGAAHLYHLLKDLSFPEGSYISALPNAGYPVSLRGKTIYGENEAYFVEMAAKLADLGLDLIGGCCGTTPQYIKDLNKALQDRPRPLKKTAKLSAGPVSVRQQSVLEDAVFPRENPFLHKLSLGEKPVLVELDPPFGIDAGKVLKGAKLLKEAGADLITLSDSPMARARMDAGALAGTIERETGMQVMPHLCCRDKNLIGLRSAILGDYFQGIRQMLFVTGDPVGRDARGQIKGVYDVNSIKLMQYVREMNLELFSEDPIYYGGALNYHGPGLKAIIHRMQLKIEAGASYFLTQPVYSREDIQRLRQIRQEVDTRIFCGIMPLVSYKNAMFIHNEMPGIHVPEEILRQYSPDMGREEAAQTAVRISLQLVQQLEEVTDGYYFMTPFNRAELIADIMKEMREMKK